MRLIAGVSLAALLAGCGGGGGGSTPAPPSAPVFSALMAQPAAVTFTTQAGQQSAITVAGGTAPYKVKASDARLISLSTGSVANSGGTFSVSPVASGTSDIFVTDSTGASTTVTVTTPVCLPPAPTVQLSFPAGSSTGVSAQTNAVWVADYASDSALPYINTFALRLVGSDGSIIAGTNLQQQPGGPPAGSRSLPSASYVYATSNVSGLAAGVSYQVQLVNVVYSCMPVGTFETFST